MAFSGGNRKEIRRAFILTFAVILMFSPSYVADIAVRRLKFDIGAAAGISLVLFLIGLFLLLRTAKG